MTLRRVAVLAGTFAFAVAGSVAAQVPMTGNLPTFDSAPPAPPPGAAGAPQFPGQGAAPPPGMSGGPPGGGQEPPCFRDFLPLREAAEKRAGAIKNAAEHKAPREQICQLFKDFAVAEGKVIKFVTDNQVACQIPPQAIGQMKANHDRTVKTKENVCGNGPMGAGPAGPPPGPRLSDELGVRGVAEPSPSARGHGTFDTLTGSTTTR